MSSHDKSTSSLLDSMLDLVPGIRRRHCEAVVRTEEEIQDWILARVAKKLELDPDEVNVREPFSDYGLDSRTAVALSGDLERWLGMKIPPTLVWDFPTIESASKHLAEASLAKYGTPTAEVPNQV